MPESTRRQSLAPFMGTVTTHVRPSLDEIRRRVGQAIGNSRFVWPPPQLLPMLPNQGTKTLVSEILFPPTYSSFSLVFLTCVVVVFAFQLSTTSVTIARAALLEDMVRNRVVTAKMKRWVDRTAKHKQEIDKRAWNEKRAKR